MIFEWFVGFLVDTLGGLLLSVLPEDTSGAFADLAPVFSTAKYYNEGLPIAEFIAVMLLMLTLHFATIAWGFLRKLFSHVPAIGGKG